LHLARAQPTGAGPRLFTKTVRPNDTIQITTTAVSRDTMNVDTARLGTKIAACQGEASEFELKAQTDTVLVEVTTASRLATETLALAGTSQWTLSIPTVSANTRKNRSGKSTAGATKITTVTATAIGHTERDTTAAATASVTTRRTATIVSRARRRLLLVVSVQLRRCLASTGRRERRRSASAKREKNKSGNASGSTKDLVNMSTATMTAGSVRSLSQKRGAVEEVQTRMSLHSNAATRTSTKTVDSVSPSKAARGTSLLHLAQHTISLLLLNRLALEHTTASQLPTATPIDLMTASPAKHMRRRRPTTRTRTTVDAWSKYSASLVSQLKSLARIQTRIVNAVAESASFARQSVKIVR
jgi:hypothetical protein